MDIHVLVDGFCIYSYTMTVVCNSPCPCYRESLLAFLMLLCKCKIAILVSIDREKREKKGPHCVGVGPLGFTKLSSFPTLPIVMYWAGHLASSLFFHLISLHTTYHIGIVLIQIHKYVITGISFSFCNLTTMHA